MERQNTNDVLLAVRDLVVKYVTDTKVVHAVNGVSLPRKEKQWV